MTDNEIIKALECCYASGRCEECPLNSIGLGCIRKVQSHSLDLINRQQAEIERSNALIDAAEEHFSPLPFKNAFDEYIVKAKSEARKEFAEELRSKARKYTEYDEGGWDRDVYAVEVAEIDNLLEEMEKKT